MLVVVKRVFRAGWKNFFRQGNLSLATTLVLIINISLLSFLFLFEKMTFFFAQELEAKTDISVYLKDGVPEEEIAHLKQELTENFSIVEIEYISKEKALERFVSAHQDEPEVIESLNELGINPFLASFNIRAENEEDYQAIADFLEQERFSQIIEKIDYYRRKEIIKKIFSLSGFVKKIGISTFVVLGTVAVLITFNTIRLAIFSQKEEILIMRLVGASNWFIKTPFLIQGLICAGLAFLFSLIIIGTASYFLSPKIESITGFDLFAHFRFYLKEIIKIQVFSALALGTIPGYFAIRRYLNI